MKIAPKGFTSRRPIPLKLGRPLYAERTSAPASVLNVRVVEFKARSFHRLDVIDLGAIQIQHAGLIDKDLQIVEMVGLVQEIGRVFKCHRVAKPGASAANHRDPKTCGL